MNRLLVSFLALGVFVFIFINFLNKDEVLIEKKRSDTNIFKPDEVEDKISLSKTIIKANNNAKVSNKNVKKILKKDSISQSKRALSTENYLNDNLQSALLRVPDTYHNIFQWSQGVDEEMIEEYAQASSEQELQITDVNLEQLLSDFVYQHELSTQIEIEMLRCTPSSCEVYGSELSSSSWGVIKEDAKQTDWWPFAKDVTRNAMGNNGEMVFMTIIRE